MPRPMGGMGGGGGGGGAGMVVVSCEVSYAGGWCGLSARQKGARVWFELLPGGDARAVVQSESWDSEAHRLRASMRFGVSAKRGCRLRHLEPHRNPTPAFPPSTDLGPPFCTPVFHASPRTMRPGSLPLRPQSRPVCQLCDYILQQQPAARRSFFAAAASTLNTPALRRQPASQRGILPRTSVRCAATARRSQEHVAGSEDGRQWGDRIAVLKRNLAEVERHIAWIESSNKVESETATLEALVGLQNIAREAIAIRSGKPLPQKIKIKQSSAGAILSMGREEDDIPVAPAPGATSPSTNELPSPQYISRLAMDLLKHPNIFISPQVLEAYIRLQRLVGCPRAIPEILYLYANKPVPELGSSPPKFSKPSPKAAKQAIPAHLAEEALGAAIETKDMPLALDIVEVAYRAPAWKRNRMVTKLGLPSFLVSITPLAIYMIAQEASVYSGYIDPTMFKTYAFLGISTYVLCTGTLGFVALTTHNDHHTRVVWRPGTPLLDRYAREDERAALDRIACAWGFKEDWRRGDEEGEEWEGLRELIALRGMVLDKPDLMPGMNA